jgi:hypothetical protein
MEGSYDLAPPGGARNAPHVLRKPIQNILRDVGGVVLPSTMPLTCFQLLSYEIRLSPPARFSSAQGSRRSLLIWKLQWSASRGSTPRYRSAISSADWIAFMSARLHSTITVR